MKNKNPIKYKRIKSCVFMLRFFVSLVCSMIKKNNQNTFSVQTSEAASSKYTLKYSLFFRGGVRHLVHIACMHLAL